MNSLQQKLNQLNLTTMSQHLDETLTDAASKNLSAAEAFEALLDRELVARQTRRCPREHELEMAREIQLSILPHEIPKIRGLEIAARYIPMSSVAGDFYDFIVVDEKHIGILIADVSGHGLPAALIASMLKFALAAQSSHAFDPARVLAGLNQSLCGKFKQHFVTAAYIFVDMEKNSIGYAGAGHPPLLLWRTSRGNASEVLQNGLILGLFPEATYSVVEVLNKAS